jgi:hypothetical protein
MSTRGLLFQNVYNLKKNSNHRILTGLPPLPRVPRGHPRYLFCLFLCTAATPRRFFYLYIHKHNSHIYLVILSTCLEFFVSLRIFLRNSGHLTSNHIGGVIGSPCGGEFDLRWGQNRICIC